MKIDVSKGIEFLLLIEYEKEWIIIDGIRQHPEGLNFQEWLDEKRLS